MRLTATQIKKYKDNGFLLIRNVFDLGEIKALLKEMAILYNKDSPRRILERNGQVRSLFAPEIDSHLFAKTIKLERLVIPSMQLLNNKVYVHQTKINSKFAMEGEWWEWHRDYTFWKKDDGMPLPHITTAMIFLSDINEFNGPLFLIPGSHKAKIIEDEKNEDIANENDSFNKYKKSTEYMTALTVDLKYTLKKTTIKKWAKRNGIISAKGNCGSVLFFHGDVFHASANNISPWDRHTFLISYNSIDNILPDIPNPRPEFIANRNFTELIPIPESKSRKHI
jgi:ectoine hydroxylase